MMQCSLRSAVATLRSSFLQRLRLKVPSIGSGAEEPRYRVAATFGRDIATRGFSSEVDEHLTKEEVTDRILSVVKRHQKVDPAKVTPQSHLQNDLGLDSLDNVEIVMAFEEEFAIEIPDAEADKIVTLSDAIEYIAPHPRAK